MHERGVGVPVGLGYDQETRPVDVNDPHPDRVADVRLRPERAQMHDIPTVEESRVAAGVLADREDHVLRGEAADGDVRRTGDERSPLSRRHRGREIGGR
jgi:hypothetical protein